MTEFPPSGLENQRIARLCAEHLREEETLLRAGLEIIRGVEEALAGRGPTALAPALGRHAEFCLLAQEIRIRRLEFRAAMASQLNMQPHEVTLGRVFSSFESTVNTTVVDHAARVSRLAETLAATTRKVSIHLRIYLDCYRNILRDLTHTATNSGRYGPGGQAESFDYRPLLSIHG